MTDMLVATRTFLTEVDGKRIRVVKGKTRVRADHELVQGREQFFKPADGIFADVEDTTARPGAKRSKTTSTRTTSASGGRRAPRRKKNTDAAASTEKSEPKADVESTPAKTDAPEADTAKADTADKAAPSSETAGD